jgi:threonine dehydrogenase-like Zn-dependent dehydrogenase
LLACIVRRHRLVPVDKPTPEPPKGWVLVRVRLAGICNTDLEILRGYHAFRGTPGHEFVGEVAGVRGVASRRQARWLGRRVVGEINVACAALGIRAACAFCRRGLKAHCANRKVLGIVAHDGAFAEYLALPLENLHAVPDSVSDEQAVFTEPLAAACQILAQVRVRDFKKAAVLGDGKLAQLIARVLRVAGLRVVMFGKHEEKLAIARSAGIETRRIRGHASRPAKDLSRRFPLLVEATGSPSGLAAALELTEPRGTLILKSTFHGAPPFAAWPIVVNEINLIGSRCGPFGMAMELLQHGKVDPTPLISRTFPIAHAAGALRFAQQPGSLKVLLKP